MISTKMREVSAEQVHSLLVQVGLSAGQGVMVHSALHLLGRPAQGPNTYLQALSQALNIPLPSLHLPRDPQQDTGTLAVPAFNFGFARGEAFDPSSTPAVGMGVLSETVRQLPEARRTPHPLQSMAVLGAHAAELAARDTPGAFDPGSSFERLLDLDFSILLLGADIQAVSLLHYSEQRAQVPYRYWKDFNGLVRIGDQAQIRTYRMYVRDMELDPRLEIYAIQHLLAERGQWRQTTLNYGTLALFKARDFTAAADELLAADPWCFVTNRPT